MRRMLLILACAADGALLGGCRPQQSGSGANAAPNAPTAAAVAAAQSAAIAFWKDVEGQGDLCRALTEMSRVPAGDLRHVTYEPVRKFEDQSLVLGGVTAEVQTKTLRRFEAALKSCPEFANDDPKAVETLRRIDDLYAAMMIGMWNNKRHDRALMPSAHILAASSRLWILGQIRDRTADPAEKAALQAKIDRMVEFGKGTARGDGIP